MKQHIVIRAEKLADYILDTSATVRDASKIFDVSKSTVHKDVSERLKLIDEDKWAAVKRILDFNLSERHIRGGTATKEKYKKK